MNVNHRIRAAFWCVAPVAGFLQTWGYRFFIEPDGVNYLDIADAYLRHDWPSAVNSYWSPLYSWLLAGIKWVFAPSGYWESTVLHLLNFVILLAVLFCGEFLIRGLIKERREGSLPDWAIGAIAYSLLLFVSLFMNSAYLDTPDLCASALIYLAGGLLIRIRSGRATSVTFAALGVVLGFAYFSKTVMFLVAFAFLASIGIRRGAVLALSCFAAVTLPWIIVLSYAVGHLTYGDSGPLNYAWYVAHSGSPIHPPRAICTSPQVEEFASPIRATYPPWYNPPYWSEGLHPRFDLKAQYAALGRNTAYYLHLLTGQKEYLAGFLLIFLTRPRLLPIRWHLLIPAFWGFGLYALVHVESRLVGVFFVFFWLALFSCLRVRSQRLVAAVVLAIVSATTFKIVKGEISGSHHDRNVQWQVTQTLQKRGIAPGSLLAVLGHSNEGDYWAHVGGFRIVADVPLEEVQSYWSATHEKRAQISSSLASLGVKAIVSATVPPIPDGWQPLGDSGFYVSILRAPGRIDEPR